MKRECNGQNTVITYRDGKHETLCEKTYKDMTGAANNKKKKRGRKRSRRVALQKGGDLVSSLNALTSDTKLPWARFPGEKHNFSGPGTNLDERLNPDETPKSWSKPVNRVDDAAYRRDLAYAKHSDTAKRIVADKKMIKELDETVNCTLKQRMERAVVKPIFKTKVRFRI